MTTGVMANTSLPSLARFALFTLMASITSAGTRINAYALMLVSAGNVGASGFTALATLRFLALATLASL